MKYEDYICIETQVKYKYQNILIPEIVSIIRDYLFQYPDKRSIYIDKRINVNDLIRFIATNKNLQQKPNIEPKDILDLIKEYVEK